MNYCTFLSKILVKNKLNVFPVFFPIFIVFFLLIMNTRSQSHVGFIGINKLNNNDMAQVLKEYTGYLEGEKKEFVPTEEDLKGMTEASISLKENIKLNETMILYAEQDKWDAALKLRLKLLEKNEIHDIEKGDLDFRGDFVESIYNERATYKELIKYDLSPNTKGTETQGFTFTYRMMDMVFPVLFIICFSAILSNVFCSNFVSKINWELLFPTKMLRLQAQKIVFGFIIGVFTYLVTLVFSFSLASLMNGMSSGNYPINIVTEDFSKTLPIKIVGTEALVLQICALLFTVVFVYSVAILTKTKLTTLFVSVILLGGMVLTTGMIAPVNSISHLMPTTYFKAISVVTNELATECNNMNITFKNGLFTLLLWSIILFFFMIIIQKKSEYSSLWKRETTM